MPTWHDLPLNYEPWEGQSDTFSRSSSGFSAATLAKGRLAMTGRQAHFEAQAEAIAWHMGTNTIPVFIAFSGERRRMDKGCVGHAVESGFLAPPADGATGILEHVTLARPGPASRSVPTSPGISVD